LIAKITFLMCPAPIQTLSQRFNYRSTPEKSGNR
jgi:hypothetical protein